MQWIEENLKSTGDQKYLLMSHIYGGARIFKDPNLMIP